MKTYKASPSPPRWTVDHHLPGGRYGCIMIKLDDENVARMCHDTPEMLAMAERIVAAMNAKERR